MAQPHETPAAGQGAPRRTECFSFGCTHCDSVLEADRSQGGAAGRCPSCGAVFTIPEVDPHTGVARHVRGRWQEDEERAPVHAYAAAGGKAPQIVRRDDGGAAIRCPRCAADGEIDDDYCRRCGAPFTLEGAGRALPAEYDGAAVGALLLAVVSLPLCMCSVAGAAGAGVAAALSWWSLGRMSPANHTRRGRGLAIAGAAIAVLGLAVVSARVLGWL